MKCLWTLYTFLLFVLKFCETTTQKPNIIVIIADDMGFNDVGFHGSDEIPTPNIDALAYNGVILNSHYTQSLCTPSRATFLTGKYPIHTGMQQLVILEPEPWGLPLNETLVPQILKENGYSTHAIGKWHLGFFEKEYTPTYRGFDTHYGYFHGLQDYYTHMTHATYVNMDGYDMRRNLEVDYNAKGKYSTTLFTQEAVNLIREHDTKNPMFMYMAHLAPHTGNADNPLQAPDEEIAKFAHIKDPERRIYAEKMPVINHKRISNNTISNHIHFFKRDNGSKTTRKKQIFYLDETWVNEGYIPSKIWEDSNIKSYEQALGVHPYLECAMVSMLDQSVGAIVGALRDKKMLQNSVILFMSDNGAPPLGVHANHGSNYPFRGTKNSVWEGGHRNIAAVWSPLIKKPQRVSNHLMHISDWLPTFYSIAGLNKTTLPKNIDGMDMWDSISMDTQSPRTEFVYNIDDFYKYGGVRQGDWKYIYGSATEGHLDVWYGNNGTAEEYFYDIQQILTSKTATSLTGLITYEQIQEKYSKDPPRNIKPIDKTLIQKLRKDATIICTPPDPDQLEDTKCYPLKSPCLFNIKDDPCERINLASSRPNIVKNLEQLNMEYRKNALPPRNKPTDLKADPVLWNNTWVSWRSCDSILKTKLTGSSSLSSMGIILIIGACLLILLMIVVLARINTDRRKKKSQRVPSNPLVQENNV